MRRKSLNALRKTIAALLSVLIVTGTLFVAPVISGSAKIATPDEKKPRIKTGSGVTKSYELFADDEAYAVKNSNGKNYYFDGGKVKKLYYRFFPKTAAEFDPSKPETLSLKIDLKSKLANQMEVCKPEGYKAEKDSEGNITLTVDVEKALQSGLKEGVNRLVFVNKNSEGTPFNDIDTTFEVVKKGPAIGDFKYDGGDNNSWTNKNVKVTFEADKDIVDKASCKCGSDDVTVSSSDGKYSFIAEKNDNYTVTLTDKFGYKTEKATDKVKIDKSAPVFELLSITDAATSSADDMTGKWTKGNLKVTFKLSDNESGVSKHSVSVKGVKNNNAYTVSESGGEYFFVADTMQDYKVSYDNNAGEAADYTIEKSKLKICKSAPAAEDVTVTFSADESDADAALRKLSFGLYDNRKVFATVDVDTKDGAPVKTLSLLNGTSALSGAGNKFALPVLDTEDGKYDLNIKLTDEAGNSASYNMLTDSVYVKIKNKDKVEELLNDESRVSFEVIISQKIKPDILDFEADGDASVTQIPAGKEISVKVKDEVVGLKEAVLMYKKTGDTEYAQVDKLDNSETSKIKNKTLKFTVPAAIESGKYDFKVLAVNNCGNASESVKTYTIDNSAPQVGDADITYENDADKIWTNKNSKVSVKITDDISGVGTVTYRKSTDSGDGKPLAPVNKVYSFTADEYATYIISISDSVGNHTEITTKPVKIDKEKPRLTQGFTYSESDWTNKPVKVSFKVKDYPSDTECSGISTVKLGEDELTAEGGVYSFEATDFGKKTIVVTDKAGNSDSFETAEIKYDNKAPAVSEVAVENGKNYRDYGVYSNEDLTVIFTAVNEGANPSPLSDNAIILDGANSDVLKFVKTEGSKYFYKAPASKAAKLVNLRFKIKDTAGNSSSVYKLKASGKNLSVQVAADNDPEVYDILASLDDVNISNIEVSGLESKNGFYKGEKAVITSKFTDNNSGLSAIKVEFGKVASDVDIAEAALTNITDKVAASFAPDTKKETEVPVSYETDKLESGRYIFRMTAVNNAGNKSVKTKEIFVDNDAPVIKSVKINGSISNADNNGVYSNSSVDVELEIDDTLSSVVKSSGITNVKFIHSGDTLTRNASQKESANITFSLDVNNSSSYKNIKFTVEDAIGNGKDVVLPITDFKPTVDGKTLTPGENFEIVSSNNTSNIENITADSGDKKDVFEGVSYDLGTPFISDGNKLFVNKDGKLFVTIRDSLSGIDTDKTEVTLNGAKVTSAKLTPTMSGSKASDLKIEFATTDVYKDGIPDGEYEAVFTVYNNSGVKKTVTSHFTVDKTAPVVESVAFAPAETTAVQNLLNVLTFGLFSDSDVKVTLTIKDADPSCGISDNDVILDSAAGYKVSPVAASFKQKDGKYTKDFIISVSDDISKSNYKDIVFTINDNLQNEIKAKYYSTNVKINGEDKAVDKNFDIILNNSDSTIKINTEFDKGADVVEDGFKFENFDYSDSVDGTAIFSDAQTSNGTVTAQFSDELKGLNEITAEIIKGDAAPAKVDVIAPDLLSSKVLKADAKVNISALKLETGSYTLSFTVKNNVGQKKKFSVDFDIDKTTPEFEKLELVYEQSDVDKLLNILSFGLYSNGTMKAVVTISDAKPSARILCEDVKLTSAKGESVNGESTFSSENETRKKVTYKKEFTLAAGTTADKSNYKDLTLNVKDKFNNKFEAKYYDGEVVCEDKTVKADEKYDLVINNDKTNIVLDGAVEFENFASVKEGDKVYYSNRFNQGSKIVAKFVDSVSGIADVKAVLTKDGKKDSKEELPLTVTPANTGAEKITSVNTVFNADGKLESGEYTITYTVKNNIGLKADFGVSFLVDETNPSVEQVKFIPQKEGTAADAFFNALTFGLYSKTKVKAEVTITDAAPSSGIEYDKILLTSEKGEKVEADTSNSSSYFKDGKYVKVFDLSVGSDAARSNYKDLKVTVTDKLNNSYSGFYYADSQTKVNDEKHDADSKFDIVVNKDPENIKIDKTFDEKVKDAKKDGFAFENFEDARAGEGDYDGGTYSEESKKHATISARFIDELSGIKAVEATLKTGKTDKPVRVKCMKSASDATAPDFDGTKTTSVVAQFDATDYGVSSGAFILTFKVTNNSEVSKEFKVGFNIDESAPTLEKVIFKKGANNAADQILNLLTFGLYSNNKILVEVIVSDESPSAGISESGISLTNDSNGEVSPIAGSFKRLDDKDDGREYYSRSFELKVGNSDKNSFFNKLKISLKDNFDNKSKEYKYNDKDVSVVLDSAEKEIDVTKGFDAFDDIVATKTSNKPDINVLGSVTKKGYRDSKNYLWFNDDFTYAAVVKDTTSKIQKIAVYIENSGSTIDVTQYAKFYELDENMKPEAPGSLITDHDNGVFTKPSAYTGKKYSVIKVVLDLNSVDDDYKQEGKSVIKIRAWGNNVSTTKDGKLNKDDCAYNDKFEFHFDKTGPVITSFYFDTSKKSKLTEKLSKTEDNKTVSETDYSFFFKDNVKVTVTAADIAEDGDSDGSGVKSITCFLMDKTGNTKKKVGTFNVDKNNEVSFTVKANFKGRIFAYATDFVENEGDEYYPNDTIVENQKMHAAKTDVTFELEETPYKDFNGQNLYNKSTTVSASVKSSYAGISKVYYSVIAPYGSQSANHDQTIDVPAKCRSLESIDNWTIDTKQRNLASVMSGEISVTNDSNDIVVSVTVTDHSGYSTTKTQKLSIDKTKPRIEVSYNNKNKNTVEGKDYYNKDRVATVTVYERNFDPEGFKAALSNTHGGKVPSGVKVLAWAKSPYSKSNPDNTPHKLQYTFHDDGDYEVGFDCKDIVKNQAKTYGKDKFTVDQTKPVINVTFDNNNAANHNYYNADRTATITIKEHNFLKDYVKITKGNADNDFTVSGFSSAGTDTWKATIHFHNDGNYAFNVNFEDRAKNAAKEFKVDKFYIDQTPGEIKFEGADNNKAYNKNISPKVSYDDPNFQSKECLVTRVSLDPEKLTWKEVDIEPIRQDLGNYFQYNDFPREPKYDGVYVMKATLIDMAGNKTVEKRMFSVNRFGSTFALLDQSSAKLVRKQRYTNDAPDIVITEINVNPITMSTIKINCNDEIKTLTQGKDYSITASGNSSEWHRYDYHIKKSNFDEEGNYTVTLTTTDYVKTTLSNRTAYRSGKGASTTLDRTCPVSFVVDKSAPNIIVSGIESGQMYEEASKNIHIICEDLNISDKELVIKFDGKELSPNDYVVTKSPGSIEISTKLNADGNTSARDFYVSISDKAGNVGESDTNNFYLSATWFARLIHYYLGLIIAVGAVLIAGIGVGLFMLTKKRKRENNV